MPSVSVLSEKLPFHFVLAVCATPECDIFPAAENLDLGQTAAIKLPSHDFHAHRVSGYAGPAPPGTGPCSLPTASAIRWTAKPLSSLRNRATLHTSVPRSLWPALCVFQRTNLSMATRANPAILFSTRFFANPSSPGKAFLYQ